MSKKIPCGGFYLDDMLNVNDNGELSINGDTPYQQLVTDGEGGVKWEDRLAYEGNRVVVEVQYDDGLHSGVILCVKVSDEVPSWASIDVPMKIWATVDVNSPTDPKDYRDLGNGSFSTDLVFIIMTDNVEYGGVVFPEKGVYFYSNGDTVYATGIASADSDTPEITWDGNIKFLKAIDPKYIPNELNEIILPSSTSGSSKKFKITVNDAGTISATEVT